MKDRKFISAYAAKDPIISPFKKRDEKGILRQWYRFVADWHVRILDKDCNGIDVVIPAGYESNSASCPRMFRWIVSPHSVIESAFLHDFNYGGSQFTKKEADDIFNLTMEQWSEYSTWRRVLGYAAVKFFGGSHYNNEEKK